MPQIGPLEILVVFVVALIVFGPEKLPEMARKVGRAASELRRMTSEIRTEFTDGIDDDERPSKKSSLERPVSGARGAEGDVVAGSPDHEEEPEPDLAEDPGPGSELPPEPAPGPDPSARGPRVEDR